MIIKRSDLITRQASRYVESVFSARLKEEGFVSRNNNIHWYRVVGNQILQSIYFYTEQRRTDHIFLDVGYGIHPLYIRPKYFSGALLKDSEQACLPECIRKFLAEPSDGNSSIYLGLGPYAPDISIMCPARFSRGLYTFDHILLPIFNETKTVEKAYDHHIRILEGYPYPIDICYNGCSLSMMDEIVYMGDEERYSRCKKRLNQILTVCQDRQKSKRPYKEDPMTIAHCQNLWDAMYNGKRQDYLEILEIRRQENIQELEKKVGIRILS